ncbi:MAG: hypothetical protein BWY26_01222 [Elusimicrobia bacterium ADurb.Bin231]|nr:MAG: hypothetical protein BWY26_01222 [Elusimicrobia bacterium ADurb.Bin231]
MADIFEFFFQFFYLCIIKKTALGLWLFNPDKGIGSNKFGFKVRQWPNAKVILCFIRILINNKRDKKPELAYLGSDWLEVNAVDAVFNQVEFAAIIQFIVIKSSFNISNKIVTDLRVINCHRFFNLPFFPKFVLRVYFVQNMHQLVQHPHRERAGTAGRVENFTVVDSIDKNSCLLIIKPIGIFKIFFSITDQ